ncbi:hypothetical protein S144_31 [Shewanella sp. phage 1/44]|uniref:hypothetical protein n=1 Tax=Shewanella sp. phage 1/44 TaxID=1458862 RepID=UPI0004F80BA9|nr:hypothetical protein S144_31 [Shewanella sp. phage 1/44]AHK11745.1 hypothetical protein S144_31 [Shewanella sp. phage 1/44]
MASIAKAAFDRAAKSINSILGDSFTYWRKVDEVTTPNIMVTINRNKKVNDAFGNLIGYRNEASILKSDLTDTPAPYDIITDAAGTKWRIGEVTIENVSKWYVDVQEV